MRRVAVMVIVILTCLFIVCSVNAFVYFVEAENFDPDKSEPVVGGCVWQAVTDRNASNESYMQYTGAHAGATTSLLYPIPKVTDNAGQWKVWVKCLMPDGGSNSYFFYVSTDGGNKWGPQETAGGAEGPDWVWQGWVLSTPLEKGDDNVLKISEREDAKADVICIRNDGLNPTDEEYEKWLEEHKDSENAVEPDHKIAITWGRAKSAS